MTQAAHEQSLHGNGAQRARAARAHMRSRILPRRGCSPVAISHSSTPNDLPRRASSSQARARRRVAYVRAPPACVSPPQVARASGNLVQANG